MKQIAILFCSFFIVFGCTRDPLPEPETPITPPPTVPVTPTATLSGTYILLSDTPLKTLLITGQALANDTEVEGLWSWKAPETTYDQAGEFDARWLFTPKDAARYNAVEGVQKITVKLNWIAVEQVTLTPTARSLAIGSQEPLTATVLPKNASDQTIVWSSSHPQIATVDPSGVVTALAAGQAVITATAVGNQTATCTITVPSPIPSVYVIGNTTIGPNSGKALFWIDNVLQPLEHESNAMTTSLFVSGKDTYITGQIWDADGKNPVSVYWKNGKIVYLTDQGNNPVPTSIFVVGNDVYVSGFDIYISEHTAGYWKNGKFYLYNIANTEARSIYVSGDDVYMVGRDIKSNTALLWKNGTATSIAGMQNAVSVQVSDGHLYAAGYGNNAALYTDGTVKELFHGTTYANAMFVSGSDIYVCGEDSAQPLLKGWYWHNGTVTNLRDGDRSVNSNSIYVAGQDVYVAGSSFVGGTENSLARLWINGVPQSLPSGDIEGSSAIGVVVQ